MKPDDMDALRAHTDDMPEGAARRIPPSHEHNTSQMPANIRNSRPRITVKCSQAPDQATPSYQLNGKNQAYLAIAKPINDAK